MFTDPVIHSGIHPVMHSVACLFIGSSGLVVASMSECMVESRGADLQGGGGARQLVCSEVHAGQVEHGIHHPVLVHWAAPPQHMQSAYILSSLHCSTVIVSEGCIAIKHWLLCRMYASLLKAARHVLLWQPATAMHTPCQLDEMQHKSGTSPVTQTIHLARRGPCCV